MTALHIPDRWSDVSAEWMTAALAPRFPGAEVANTGIAVVEGSALTGWRLAGWLEEIADDIRLP